MEERSKFIIIYRVFPRNKSDISHTQSPTLFQLIIPKVTPFIKLHHNHNTLIYNILELHPFLCRKRTLKFKKHFFNERKGLQKKLIKVSQWGTVLAW